MNTALNFYFGSYSPDKGNMFGPKGVELAADGLGASWNGAKSSSSSRAAAPGLGEVDTDGCCMGVGWAWPWGCRWGRGASVSVQSAWMDTSCPFCMKEQLVHLCLFLFYYNSNHIIYNCPYRLLKIEKRKIRRQKIKRMIEHRGGKGREVEERGRGREGVGKNVHLLLRQLLEWYMLMLSVTPTLTLTLILILMLTLPQTENPIITLILSLCCLDIMAGVNVGSP